MINEHEHDPHINSYNPDFELKHDPKNAFQLGYDSVHSGLQNPFWRGSRPCKEFSRGHSLALMENVKKVFCLVDFKPFLTKNTEYILIKENDSSFVILDNTLNETGFQKSYFIVSDEIE